MFLKASRLIAAKTSTLLSNSQFNIPSGIAVDSTQNIYVADSNNHRIEVFDSAGNFKFKFGSSGSGNGQFSYPFGIAVDSS